MATPTVARKTVRTDQPFSPMADFLRLRRAGRSVALLCDNGGQPPAVIGMVVTGVYYAFALVAGGFAVSYFTRPVWGTPLFVLAAFCLYFFRDPEREIPAGPVAVAPADGKVVAVKPAEGGLSRISIFLSVFDVHVNRSPIAGTITEVHYKKGEFLVANREDASARNEQNTVTVEGEGTRVIFKQIAGLIARRIVFYRKPGDQVKKGERVGLIQFGSRADVLLGPEWEVLAREGQRVRAGSSVLARRRVP